VKSERLAFFDAQKSKACRQRIEKQWKDCSGKDYSVADEIKNSEQGEDLKEIHKKRSGTSA
jgi:hypothetical protein